MNISAGVYWDQSWSPVRGCSKVSPGCASCWAERMAGRFAHLKDDSGRTRPGPYCTFSEDGRWTGRVELIESELTKPLHWRKPRIVALNWMGDLFHEKVPDEAIDRVFAVMALCPQHKFLVLTKRARRMREHIAGVNSAERFHDINVAAQDICQSPHYGAVLPTQQDGMVAGGWPLPNVALGVSVEDQDWANSRIPDLLATPATMRFVSVEPLLGHIDIACYLDGCFYTRPACEFRKLNWAICGGESGTGARPPYPDWVRSIRDQCQADGAAFLFKGWGEWAPDPLRHYVASHAFNDGTVMGRFGKKAAGRLLDGRTWDQFPVWLTVNGHNYRRKE